MTNKKTFIEIETQHLDLYLIHMNLTTEEYEERWYTIKTEMWVWY